MAGKSFSFDAEEVQALILALRYWRSRRRNGSTRRMDPSMTPETIDLLLVKLRSATDLGSLPSYDLHRDSKLW
jgi:hypothetical protein